MRDARGVPFMATAWSGWTYGLRIPPPDRDKHFSPPWSTVVLDLEGGPVTTVHVSASFWRHCPELRSSVTGDWIAGQAFIPWSHGGAPSFTMEPAGGDRFIVHRAQWSSAQG